MSLHKANIYLPVIFCIGAFFLYSCGGAERQEPTGTETTITPTEGMITTVREIEPDKFKIEDEQVVPKPEDSRIIAKYIDNTIDTLTLAEAQVLAAQDTTATGENNNHRRRSGGLLRAASFGLMGYMMGRSMSSHRPSASAYVDQKTYNRVSNGAGARVNQTAKRTTTSRPSGRSGYGGGKSTRSYGG